MKLYVHLGGQIHPVSVDGSSPVSFLSTQLCNRFNYSQISLSKYPNGKEIHPEIQISTFFSDMDDVFITKSEENKVETVPHLKAPEALQYTSLSKYSFYEYDSNWVRVEVPFPGIGKHRKEKISCVFDTNSFVLSILDYGKKNYQFSVLRLQCHINPESSKYAVLADKIRISLRKVKDTDNWFSLFKAKTIGGDD